MRWLCSWSFILAGGVCVLAMPTAGLSFQQCAIPGGLHQRGRPADSSASPQCLQRLSTPTLTPPGIAVSARTRTAKAMKSMPPDCCGDDSPRSMRLPAQGIDLPGWMDRLLTFLFALGGLLPASIKIDEFLQNGRARIESLTNAETSDGVRVYVAHPDKALGAPLGVMLVIHQFFGLREREVDLCDELARKGFLAVAPDTFDGQTTAYVPRAISLVLPAVVQNEWGKHLEAVDSAATFALKAAQESGSGASKLSICGFCFGGGVACRYAQFRRELVNSCGVFYGKPLTDGAAGLPPVYAVFGGRDSQFPPATVDAFERLLRESDVPTEFRRYPEQAHAFVRDVEAVRTAGDAQDAWQGWLSFCQREQD